jgi:hypothetical protein
MDTSPNLSLPYILAAQAQKHVTHNEAIRALDCLVQISVLDRDLTLPPAAPPEGARYIVAMGAGSAWSGHALQVAAFQDGAWSYYVPREGWLVWVADEDKLVAFDGFTWVIASSGGASAGVNPTALVGVNATADTTNRLTVKSNAVLLSHDDVTPGTGDMRVKLNKSVGGQTASLLFQTGYSGRAEMGTTGDDNFHFKVSGDGATWHDSLLIDKATGSVAFPSGMTGVAASGSVDLARTYGLDTTGATNVAVALQAALSAVSSTGRTCVLPGGIYELGSATIAVPANAIVLCVGGVVLRRSADPATPAPMIDLATGARWFNGELQHSGSGIAVVSVNNCALRAASVTGAAVHNVAVTSVNSKWHVGVLMQSATRCRAEGCHVSGVSSRAYYVYLSATDLSFVGCSVEGGSLTAYGFCVNPNGAGAAQSISMAQCSAVNVALHGFELSDQTFDSKIVDCRVVGAANTGFLVQKANGVFAQFNLISACQAINCATFGFQISDTFYNQINGCSTKSCGTALGFTLGAQLNSATGFRADVGSTLGAQPGHGVRFGAATSRNDVVGLSCIGNAGAGVLFDAGSQSNRVIGRAYNNAGGNFIDNGTGNVKDLIVA